MWTVALPQVPSSRSKILYFCTDNTKQTEKHLPRFRGPLSSQCLNKYISVLLGVHAKSL